MTSKRSRQEERPPAAIAPQARSRVWLRRATVLASVVALVALVTLPARRALERQDRTHAAFYETGKSVNAFLKDYCRAAEMAINGGDTAPLRALGGRLPPPSAGAGQGEEPFVARREGGVLVARRENLERLEKTGGSGGDSRQSPSTGSDIAVTLPALEAVTESTCKILLIEQAEPGQWADLTVRLVFDGLDAEGRLVQDRSVARWRLEWQESGWRIGEEEPLEASRAATEETTFATVAPSSIGIDFVHQRDPKLDRWQHSERLRFDVVGHAMGGLAAADYDLDGRDDLFFSDGVSSRLYRNETAVPSRPVRQSATTFASLGDAGLPVLERSPELRFRDVTDELGLAGIDQASSALFADFDGDGDRDLFVARYLAPNLFYRQEDGLFVERSEQVGLNRSLPSVAATLLDYDRDGFVDIYLAVYGHAFEEVPRIPFFARNGRPNRLFRNVGGERFEDVTEAAGVGDRGWSLAVAAGDYDGDGWSDLAVANDFGRKKLYRNNGDGTFSERAKEAGVLDISGGMGLAFGDYDGDQQLDLYTSNIQSNQRWFGEDLTIRQYLRNVLGTRYLFTDVPEYIALWRLLGETWRSLGTESGEGNSLFHNDGDGTFTELDDGATNVAGWGWSVAFVDFDNDADQDLYAANGWISNTPETDL